LDELQGKENILVLKKYPKECNPLDGKT